MKNNSFSNPIYRYFLIANCLFFSFTQTVFATRNTSAYTLKSRSIHVISLDSINLDTLLMDFNAVNKLTDTLTKAQAFQKLASKAYEDYPDYALRFLDSAQVYFKRLGKVKEQALCLQNMAFTYEEKLGNVDKSLVYALSAVPLWQSINREMDEANILKYIGFLYGKKAQYDSAFTNINTAIEKFGRLDNPQGVAVCYVDKGRVFQQQGTLDSCVHYLSKAKKMWITFQSPSRVFNINNDLLKVYMGYKATNNINAIIAENDALYLADSKKDIYWRDIAAFLTLCVEYYEKNNDKARSGLFQMKRKKYLESIKNK